MCSSVLEMLTVGASESSYFVLWTRITPFNGGVDEARTMVLGKLLGKCHKLASLQIHYQPLAM